MLTTISVFADLTRQVARDHVAVSTVFVETVAVSTVGHRARKQSAAS